MCKNKKKMNETTDERDVEKVEIVAGKKDKYDIASIISSIICNVLVAVTALWALFVGGEVLEMTQTLMQNQNQSQNQTQLVIEPREGDIIVYSDDDYKLLQLIRYEDITFPSKIQEVKIKSKDSVKENRVDILNDNLEDWTNRDSFQYIISNFSINPNKLINLCGTIESLTVYCDFYKDKNISTFIPLDEKDAFRFNIIDGIDDKEIKVSNINEHSKKEYVTNEVNDGIEWVKIRIEIVYKIDGKIDKDSNGKSESAMIKDTIISDWIPTDADF